MASHNVSRLAALAMAIFTALSVFQVQAHPAPYPHHHVTQAECDYWRSLGLFFRCIDGEVEQQASKRERDQRAIDDISNRLRLTREQRRLLHDEITKGNFSYQEILEIARDMFNK